MLISRLIYEWLLKKNLNLKFSAPYTQNFMTNMKIDFMGLRKYGYIFSICTDNT
ncbi:MAG: hypothetical protein MZV63_18725 [Marinilabiliales bacterium]|nr:hypothetical protein [Marinilabiliales bacterium]